eukprot:CAMPEP_0115198678 /NCGR_PEP_ID=MMETSP0270-20121206/16228_1 /TAXON_ID=71861 /ORGANISM="Scrippsiella trochoidea, Strain CCMP3099" /LENGTH=67 /DNA_ID=CAMNT_0002612055 /DNA_START=224 /DNA_END=424 /DNA_ORIENTATION=+
MPTFSLFSDETHFLTLAFMPAIALAINDNTLIGHAGADFVGSFVLTSLAFASATKGLGGADDANLTD